MRRTGERLEVYKRAAGVQLSLGEKCLRGGGMVASGDPLISNRACGNSGEPEELQVLQGGVWSRGVGERVGVGEAPDGVLVVPEAEARFRPAGDQGAFAIVLEVYSYREAMLPNLLEEIDQGKRTLDGMLGTELLAVQGPDLVDRLEPLQHERVLLRDEKDDFRIREIVPEAVDYGEREDDIPDAFPTDDENAVRGHAVHRLCCARPWIGGRPISFMKTRLRDWRCCKQVFSANWAREVGLVEERLHAVELDADYLGEG